MNPCLPVEIEAGFIKGKLANYKGDCKNISELDHIARNIDCVRYASRENAEIQELLIVIDRNVDILTSTKPASPQGTPPDKREAYRQALLAAERVVTEIGKHDSL